jgi:Dolichyl-phosphate-mannose-protein mannosyltransferase
VKMAKVKPSRSATLTLSQSVAAVAPALQSLAFIKAILIFLAAFTTYFVLRSPGLDEWDSVQFAMGVREFNLWDHQPHPPGYPLFIFCAWLAGKVFGTTPEISLHLVSALGGALFVAAWFLIIRLQFSERLAWWIAGCLAITPVVWMTATKVFTDTLAAGFLGAQIFAALLFVRRQSLASLISVALLGAATAGTRPQMFLVSAVVLFVALRRAQGGRRIALLCASVFIVGCLAWLLPMWYLQARLRPDVPAWLVYPRLAYGQWEWRLDRPHTFIGAGDWSLRYLGTRFAEHFLGWLGIGFAFIQSPFTIVTGFALSFLGLGAYLFSRRDAEDGQFWKFHAPWSLLHIAIMFTCLGGTQRYYLPIYPLLLVALIRGFMFMRVPWRWVALGFPALLVYIMVPAAIANHREQSPSIRSVRWLQQVYPPSRRKDVALLSRHVRRHVEWYAPEFQTFRKIPSIQDMPRILANKSAVYTDDSRVPLPPRWRLVPVAIFKRSVIIHVKDHTVTLFLVARH